MYFHPKCALYLPFENSFTDYSGTPHGAFSSNAGYFPNAATPMLTESSSDFTFGTGDFTLECYALFFGINTSSLNAILSFGDTVNSNGFSFTYSNASKWLAYSNNGVIVATGGTPTFNIYYHIACVRYSGKIYIYINGVLQNTGGTTFSTNLTGSQILRIGHDIWNSGPAGKFNGIISEVRVSNIARYTANYTPSSLPFVADANTKLLLHLNGNATDTSGQGHTITNNNVVFSKAASAVGSPSYVNGKFGRALSTSSGNYIKFADHPDFDWLANDFTVAFWAYGTDSQGNYDTVFGKGDSSGYMPFYISYHVGNWVTGGTTNKTSWDIADTQTITSYAQNTWTHIAAARIGTNIYYYKNGALVYTLAVSTKSIYAMSAEFCVGSGGTYYNSSFRFRGYIDEFQMYNGVGFSKGDISRIMLGMTPIGE